MSKKEGLVLLNSGNNIILAGENEHMVQRSTVASRNMERKGLRNITNLPQQFMPSIRDEKSKLKVACTEECINKLKENANLLNLLADKEYPLVFKLIYLVAKIIELDGIELQKLKSELHQVQQQNVALAQSNTQLLAELNSRKDRLKLMQHELGCKQGLLVAKKVELEVKMPKCKKTSKFLEVAKDEVPCRINRKQPSKSWAPFIVKQLEDNRNEMRLSVLSQSASFEYEDTKKVEDLLEVDSSRLSSDPLKDDITQEQIITSNLVDEEDKKSCKKSLRVRRQSARFYSEELKSDDDIFEVDTARFSSSPQGNGQNQHDDGRLVSTNLVLNLERLSSGRPSRQVTNKVSSYKEVPLNTKMRRS
uniref:Shugoshin C-terminal domain-containing protein n=1 Tax=Daucus carota subsp. sativus TaxID=79200 RepID=A0A166DQZ9_DAUCS